MEAVSYLTHAQELVSGAECSAPPPSSAPIAAAPPAFALLLPLHALKGWKTEQSLQVVNPLASFRLPPWKSELGLENNVKTNLIVFHVSEKQTSLTTVSNHS